MSTPPLVSVIIPLYNRRHLITRCVQSVLRQTYPHLEVIIVDDGSTDDCDAVLDTLAKDTRVRLIRKANGGVSSARNAGLDIASGTYVQFVDSDDELLPHATETALQAMEGGENDLVVFYSETRLSNRSTNISDQQIFDEGDCIYAIARRDLLPAPWNKLYKRDLIAGLRFPLDVSLGEDLIFNIAYIRSCARVSIIPSLLYIQHEGGEQALGTRYDSRAFHDLKAQAAAIREYLVQDAPIPEAKHMMLSLIWGCYIGCVRKLILRSGLPASEIQRTLRAWADDEDILRLRDVALSSTWDCRCLRDRRFGLLPYAVRFCHAKACIGKRLRALFR